MSSSYYYYSPDSTQGIAMRGIMSSMWGYFNENNWQNQRFLFHSWKLSSNSIYAAAIIFTFLLTLIWHISRFIQRTLDKYYEIQLMQACQQESKDKDTQIVNAKIRPTSSSTADNCSTTVVDSSSSTVDEFIWTPVTQDDDPPSSASVLKKSESVDELQKLLSTEYAAYQKFYCDCTVTFNCSQQFFRTLFHVWNAFLGLTLMMIFMTMDAGIVVTMLFAHGIGAYLFSRMESKVREIEQDTVPQDDAATCACHS